MAGRRFAALAAVLVLTGVLSVETISVQAHVLESDNGVSAVLHIAPADDPVSGVPTLIGLEFNSASAGFDLSHYTTTATVQGVSTDTSSASVPVSFDSQDTLYGTAQVTFPDPGTYTLLVHGTPAVGSTSTAVTEFSLRYEVRAERPQTSGTDTESANSAGFDSIMVGVASLGLLGIVAQYQIRQGGRYDQKK